MIHAWPERELRCPEITDKNSRYQRLSWEEGSQGSRGERCPEILCNLSRDLLPTLSVVRFELPVWPQAPSLVLCDLCRSGHTVFIVIKNYRIVFAVRYRELHAGAPVARRAAEICSELESGNVRFPSYLLSPLCRMYRVLVLYFFE